MSLTINIHNLTFAPDWAKALTAAADQPAAEAQAIHPIATRPAPGEVWPGQGGIYIGDFRAQAGRLYGLIVAPEEDIGRAAWGPEGERDLSDWDGLGNTRRLRNECPAAKLAADYTRDGHSDFYLPARRELNLASANAADLFGTESWYWSSTPYSNGYAWAVDFEDGYTDRDTRRSEFRVRPFRRFIY